MTPISSWSLSGQPAEPGMKRVKQRIFLVDDHPVVREGFARLIERQPDLEVCGQAESAGEALSRMAAVKPDLMVVDIGLPETNGIELIKQIRALAPGMRILILSMHEESVYAERAIRAGAKGYVMKEAPMAEIMGAMRSVLRGQIYASAQMRERLMANMGQAATVRAEPDMGCLTDRELEVFHLIGSGCTTGEIASRLHLSVKTVETYRSHMKQKLNLQTGRDLVRMAMTMVNHFHRSESDPKD
jgi:DNA-binding NarL/FixJ family response regulator